MKEKLKLMIAMFIVGTIGIFVHYISLPSSVIACLRAVIGSIFLVNVIIIRRKKINVSKIKRYRFPLVLSGIALGFNWILLFEAYHYTTVAVATLCYYMAPVFVLLISPFILKERLNCSKVICLITAVIGATLISGAVVGEKQDMRGIGLGLAAAVLYCSIIILNKKINEIGSMERTICQLVVAAIVMIPYVLITQNIRTLNVTFRSVLLLLVIGILHTGIVYLMFFSAISVLPAQSSAILSYIDPVTAILLSAMLLNQPLSGVQICGTILILGSTFVNEINDARSHK